MRMYLWICDRANSSDIPVARAKYSDATAGVMRPVCKDTSIPARGGRAEVPGGRARVAEQPSGWQRAPERAAQAPAPVPDDRVREPRGQPAGDARGRGRT